MRDEIKNPDAFHVRPQTIDLLKKQIELLLPGSMLIVLPDRTLVIHTHRVLLEDGIVFERTDRYDDGGPTQLDLNPELLDALGPYRTRAEAVTTASKIADLWKEGVIDEEEYRHALQKQDILLPDDIPSPE